MKSVTLGILPFLLAMSVAGVLIARHERQEQVSQAKPAATREEQEGLLAIGKRLFMERCAKCHNERGDKPLKSGPPLTDRKLSDEDIARIVSGRFKGTSDEQKRAVALYVSSFMKRN